MQKDIAEDPDLYAWHLKGWRDDDFYRSLENIISTIQSRNDM